MPTFPKILSSQFAYDIAQVILDGFSRHYRIFREANLEAKHFFQSQNWSGINEQIKGRIDCFAERVKECVVSLEKMSREVWYYVGPKDVFASAYDTFLLGDTCVRKYLLKHHADFFLLDTWRVMQNQLHKGVVPDLFSYPQHLRFIHKHLNPSSEGSTTV